MKFFKRSAFIVITVFLLNVFSACAVFDGSETSLEDSSADTAESSKVERIAAADTGEVGKAQAVAAVKASMPEITQEPIMVTEEDKEAKIDKFIGYWMDTAEDSRFCTIKKTEIGYSYTDNESNFPAEVKDGVLMIHIEVDDDYAKGVVDEATGILTITYQGQSTVFKRKQE